MGFVFLPLYFDDRTTHVAFYAGATVFPSILYGVNSSLAFMSLRLLWRQIPRTKATSRRNRIIIGYIIALHLLCTTYFVGSCIQASLWLFVIRGPRTQIHLPWSLITALNSASIFIIKTSYGMLTLLCDGLLVSTIKQPLLNIQMMITQFWRCLILYGRCRGFVRWVIRTLLLALWLLLLGIPPSNPCKSASLD
jgi:hypothetical protein